MYRGAGSLAALLLLAQAANSVIRVQMHGMNILVRINCSMLGNVINK